MTTICFRVLLLVFKRTTAQSHSMCLALSWQASDHTPEPTANNTREGTVTCCKALALSPASLCMPGEPSVTGSAVQPCRELQLCFETAYGEATQCSSWYRSREPEGKNSRSTWSAPDKGFSGSVLSSWTVAEFFCEWDDGTRGTRKSRQPTQR